MFENYISIKNRQKRDITLIEKKTITSIQALRGFAAILVVFFHYGIALKLNADNQLGILLSRGWSGVDLFFIISGFIAAYTVNIQSSGIKSAIEYLAKRIIRIIPLYYLVTILNMGHSVESFIEVAKSLLFIPIGGPAPDGLGPLYGGARVGQGWTLNYEMFFYFVVSLSILFGRAKWLFTVGFITAAIITPIAIYGMPADYGFYGFYFSNQYIGLMTNPITLEFLIGIAVYFLFTKMSHTSSKAGYLLVIASIGYFLINFYSPIFTSSRITQWAIPSALLILAMLKLEVTNKIKFNNFIMHIGNISFSIYLLHEGVQGLLSKLIKLVSKNDKLYDNLDMRVVLFVSSLIVTYYVSGLSYKYIEKALSRKIKKSLTHKIEIMKRRTI